MLRWVVLWLVVSFLLTGEKLAAQLSGLAWTIPHMVLLLTLMLGLYGRASERWFAAAAVLVLRAGESLESIAPDIWLMIGLMWWIGQVRGVLFVDSPVTHLAMGLAGILWAIAGYAILGATGLLAPSAGIGPELLGRLAAGVLLAPWFLRLVHRSRLLGAWLEESPA